MNNHFQIDVKKESTVEPTISDIYNNYFYSLYGCNQSLKDTLNHYLPHTATCFYEYLLHRPLPHVGKDAGKVKAEMCNIYLLAPFARRMIEESRFVPDHDNPDKLVPVSRAAHHHATMQFAMGCSKVAKLLYSRWNGLLGSHPSDQYIHIHSWTHDDSELTKQMQPTKFCYALMDLFLPIYVRESYSEQEIGSQQSLRLLNSLFRVAFPGETVRESIPGVILPIATDKLFYGCIWVMYPGLDIRRPTLTTKERKCGRGCDHRRDKFLRARPDKSGQGVSIVHLMPKLLGLIHEQYVPVLALQHEWLSANLLGPAREELKLDQINGSSLVPVYRCPFKRPASVSECGIRHVIEEHLFRLNENRQARTTLKEKAKLEVFKEYRVSSTRMLQLIKSVVECAEPLGIAGKSLHSVLIVGGPGTGKESLADILAAFSQSYAHGTRYTLNMAAIKPGALVPFAVSGMHFKGETTSLSFEGLLSSVRKARIAELEDGGLPPGIETNWELTEQWSKELEPRTDYPMLVLDELNSMDQDAQGVFLRFLENAEIVPIGGTADPFESGVKIAALAEARQKLRVKLSKFLVVGMMNEDPDVISREGAMEFVTGSKYLQGFIADILYEHVLKLRRLRPDIKYRMVRSGKLQIPMLCDRREDIPVLFHVYLNIAGKNRPGHDKPISSYQITLRAMSSLMAPTLRWPGNIRQLQALASRVCVIASDEHRECDAKTCWVDKHHVESGMIEIGMIPKNEYHE
jgi:transcriptional regulator with AAA-type ATPase domain